MGISAAEMSSTKTGTAPSSFSMAAVPSMRSTAISRPDGSSKVGLPGGTPTTKRVVR
jgi:hypothetical protein